MDTSYPHQSFILGFQEAHQPAGARDVLAATGTLTENTEERDQDYEGLSPLACSTNTVTLTHESADQDSASAWHFATGTATKSRESNDQDEVSPTYFAIPRLRCC